MWRSEKIKSTDEEEKGKSSKGIFWHEIPPTTVSAVQHYALKHSKVETAPR
jgi:hypothetical protein